MPAEWEPHAATWLAWPHNLDTWPGKFTPIPDIYVEIVRTLHRYEPVNICVNDAEVAAQLRQILTQAGVNLGRVILYEIPTNDTWIRDHGPIFLTRVHEGQIELAITDWLFNSWGEKYRPWDLDDVVPRKIAAQFGLPLFAPGIVLEGGSIDVNGRGTLLTTEACLLNPNRNPSLTRTEIEDYLHVYLGVSKILWLGDGIVGDDTDGHVDDLARFVDPTTVVCMVEDDPADVNYALLRDNFTRLQRLTDQDGRPLRVVPLPMPRAVEYEGNRLPASYANFYIANGVVLVPIYTCPNDQRALATLQELFPSRQIVGIPCTDLVWGLGAIHCITQQQPAGDCGLRIAECGKGKN
ncbi:MAG TPA: agmatine deiminase family protein [Candidatus Binatia bacterium]|nr:agmatine deiminase family protein [Candidatus Binatia bacterium]